MTESPWVRGQVASERLTVRRRVAGLVCVTLVTVARGVAPVTLACVIVVTVSDISVRHGAS